MNSTRKLLLIMLISGVWAGCSCDPIITSPDGGSGGGSGGGRAGGAGGGNGGGTAGGSGGGSAGGTAGGTAGGAGGGTAGGAAGGSAGGTAGGNNTQFTQYVRDQINTNTSPTATPRPATEWQALPDNAPITYPGSFFDGGM